jgi:hypothetical protein
VQSSLHFLLARKKAPSLAPFFVQDLLATTVVVKGEIQAENIPSDYFGRN